MQGRPFETLSSTNGAVFSRGRPQPVPSRQAPTAHRRADALDSGAVLCRFAYRNEAVREPHAIMGSTQRDEDERQHETVRRHGRRKAGSRPSRFWPVLVLGLRPVRFRRQRFHGGGHLCAVVPAYRQPQRFGACLPAGRVQRSAVQAAALEQVVRLRERLFGTRGHRFRLAAHLVFEPAFRCHRGRVERDRLSLVLRFVGRAVRERAAA